jgi:hypothetical protein
MAKKKIAKIETEAVNEAVNEAFNEAAVNEAAVNEDLLDTLVYETRKNGFINITHKDLASLEANNYAEVNRNNETNKGFAWRATEKGIKFMTGVPTTEKKTVKHVFAIGAFNPANVVAKEKVKRGRTSKYDFNALETVNTFIFVPATDKQPEPHKSLVSTVNTANMKYAVDSGETREVSRKPRGGTEKITKTVPVMTFEREFAVYPYTQDGVNGAAIVRIK